MKEGTSPNSILSTPWIGLEDETWGGGREKDNNDLELDGEGNEGAWIERGGNEVNEEEGSWHLEGIGRKDKVGNWFIGFDDWRIAINSHWLMMGWKRIM